MKSPSLIAGFALLLIVILAPIANFVILKGLVDPADASVTVANLRESMEIFRLGILLFMLVAVLDILVAWALYVFLEQVDRHISLLAAWLRVVYAAILLASLFSLIKVIMLLGDTGIPDPFTTDQTNAQIMLSLNMFNHAWEFGLTVFGLHLIVLGYLILKAGYMRKVLGILLIIAGLGYSIDGIGKILNADYSLGISMYTFIGELVLMFWLLIMGWRSTIRNS